MISPSIKQYFARNASNLFGLYQFCSNTHDLLQLIIETNIIPYDQICPKCSQSLKFHRDQMNYFKLSRYCYYCNSHFSIYNKTILTRSHISPPQFMALAYCWVNQYNLQTTCSECQVNHNTVTNYFVSFRDSVVDEILDGEQEQIGGKGLNVEIDETVISHRKYNRGRMTKTVWVFGGICRETDRAFALVVDNRSANTLLKEIADHIAPGSIIHSDSWKAYDLINQIPNRNYTHYTVNHSQNFIDPNTGSNTQKIERLWRSLKFQKLKSCGIPAIDTNGYVFEYVWRRNNLTGLNTGEQILRLFKTIGETFFD